MLKKRAIRVLVAKPGLDGHDRGARVLIMGLRDEGMEVIYTGLRQSPEMIAQAAVEEQTDVVALSCLSGAHCHLFPEVVKELKARDMSDVLVIGGGIILLAGFIGALIFVPWHEAIVASFFAMLVEGLEIKMGLEEVDDNIIIPLVAAIAIWGVRVLF